MNRSVLNTALATATTRILGFIRTAFLSSLLGTSSVADSFFLAFKIPNMFRKIFAEGAMQSGFIPIFSSLDDSNASNNKWSFMISVSIFLLGICGLIILLGIFFSKQLVTFFWIFSPRSMGNIEQTTTMLQIMFPYLGLICMAAILQSGLNTFQHFTVPALAPVLFSISIILGCCIGNRFPFSEFQTAIIISISVLVGGILQLFFLLFYFGYLGYLHKLWKGWTSINAEHIWVFTALFVPFVISNSTHYFGSLILDPLVLSLETGSFAALQYSIRLQELPLGVLTASITTVYLPLLSQNFSTQNKKNQQEYIEDIFFIAMLLIIPCITIALLFYKDIVSVVYQGGVFSQNSLHVTSDCFFYHALAILPISCNRILISVYQSNRNTKTPAKLTLFYLPMEIFTAFFLCYLTPHPRSIALATLISATFYSLLLITNLPKNDTFVIIKNKLFISIFLILITAMISAIVSKNVFNVIFLYETNQNLFNYTTYFSSQKIFLFCRIFFSSLFMGICMSTLWYFFLLKEG